jgi:hypothetical protein
MTILVNIALLVGLFLSGNAGGGNSNPPGKAPHQRDSNELPWPCIPDKDGKCPVGQ